MTAICRRETPFGERTRVLALAAVLALLSALPYLAGGLSASFIALDDDQYISENPQVQRGLTPETALWALTTTEHANWYPLRRLSHLVDVSLFGMDARWHHLVSVAWHAAAAVLLFFALRQMTGRSGRSLLVAMLFAVHPLQVESVAWAAERSSVQAGFFFALALLAWASFVRRPGARRYGAAVAAGALALVSKPVLVPLPLVLLLLDYWPLGRMRASGRARRPPLKHLFLEKAPLFLLAAGTAAVAIVAHQQAGGLSTLEAMPLGTRLANAAASSVSYLTSLLWPAGLAVFYPHPGRGIPPGAAMASVLVIAALTVLALRQARRRPWMGLGWLWYLGMLGPVAGIVQFGSHARADRFLYVPSIGLFVALVWLAADSGVPRRLRRPALGFPAGCLLVALASASALQASYWRDSETLFTRTLAVTTDNVVIHMALADFLEDERRFGEALAHAREAVRLRPGAAVTHGALGNAFAALGRHGEAAAAYREALGLGSDQPEIPYNLGNSFAALGRHGEAIAAYDEALRRRPGHANARANLAASLAALGRDEEAIAAYREALRIRPDFGDALGLGLLLERRGRTTEAIASYREALRLRPDAAEPRVRITVLLGSAGRR